jgi:CheY-specific phosphatase CheX
VQKLRDNLPAFLRKAIGDTFGIQIGLPVDLDIREIDGTTAPQEISVDCMSVLGLQSDKFQGTVAIGFPKASFLAILEKMVGEVHAEIDVSNSDASGEILNIIYGDFRKKLNALGYEFQPAIPSTVLGTGMSLFQNKAQYVLSVKGSSSLGPFVVSLTLMAVAPKV